MDKTVYSLFDLPEMDSEKLEPISTIYMRKRMAEAVYLVLIVLRK